MGVTIRELSKRCGLSVSAVSKALNNYPDVSDKTRQLVLKMAEEMGYFPNALARALKTNHTYNLGVLLDDKTSDSLLHQFFIVILNGFKREVERRGYDITLINRDLGGQSLSYLNHCRYRNVDGVCLMCVDFNEADVRELLGGDVPLVAIDYPCEGRDCILSDNVAGMHALVRHAAQLGHRRIAFLHGTDSWVTDARLAGFREAMAAQGLPIHPEYVFMTEYERPREQYAAVQRLLALPERPTCILMTDDLSALGGIEAIKEAGLRIPEDISIAGYDGIELIQKIHPRLTTIQQAGEEMGRQAAQRLIGRIEHPSTPVLPPQIVPGVFLAGETMAQVP